LLFFPQRFKVLMGEGLDADLQAEIAAEIAAFRRDARLD